MARKTYSIGKLLAHINWNLARPGRSYLERASYCTMAEMVLLESDNYYGFQYIVPYAEWKDHNEDERIYQQFRRKYMVGPDIIDDYNDAWNEKVRDFGEPITEVV